MTTTMPEEKIEPPKITVPGIADIKMRPVHHIDYDGDDDGFNDVAFPVYSEDQINAVTALYEFEIQRLRSELAAVEQRGREAAAIVCDNRRTELMKAKGGGCVGHVRAALLAANEADKCVRAIRQLLSTPIPRPSDGWPERIYLQHGAGEIPPFSECAEGEVSWAAENIHANDIEYTRVSTPTETDNATS